MSAFVPIETGTDYHGNTRENSLVPSKRFREEEGRDASKMAMAGRGREPNIVHGRSHMIIDLRIIITPARSTSGFTKQEDSTCAKRDAP